MTKEDLQQIAELLKPIHEELTDLRAGQEELKANVSGLETEVRRKMCIRDSGLPSCKERGLKRI